MTDIPSRLQRQLAACGLIAILRGMAPEAAHAVGLALYAQGFRLIEVPLNSPKPLASIARLRASLPADCLVGAGTVLRAGDCEAVRNAGGQFVVMPHTDTCVIRAAKATGMACIPGVATPTESFAALDAGADALKMFPAEQLGAAVLKAWRAVLRPPLALIAVGGITPEDIASYAAAGATGFGLGSALYHPGHDATEVGRRAQRFMAAWHSAYPGSPSRHNHQETSA